MVSGAKILSFLFGADKAIFPVSWSFDKGIPDKHLPETWVTIMIGGGGGLENGGGREPYISLWDDEGRRVGQYWADEMKRITMDNELGDNIYKIQHTQNRDKMVTPKYIMLSQFHKDAICVSAVQVSNGKLSSVWYGDLGAYCGSKWFLSKRHLPGYPNLTPNCVWLTGTEVDWTRAISWHLNDMLGTPAKISQYHMDQEKFLCRSTPRFAAWKQLQPDGTIPFYRPALEYDVDKETGLEGRDKDPELAVDRVEWDRNVLQTPSPKAPRSLESNVRNSTVQGLSKRQGFNHDPSHLIITESEGHRASLVCNSTTSYGWDIVSLREKKYCDMTVRKLYGVCDSNHTDDCFDLDSKMLVGRGGINVRGEASVSGALREAYRTTDHWK